MSTDTLNELRFDPPGPGSWEIDAVHFPRPVTRYWAELHPEPFARGSGEFMRYYGILLERLAHEYVNGFAYKTAVPVAEDEVPARFERASEVFEKKLWRDQLREWDETFKPASIQTHRELQSVDADALSDDQAVPAVHRQIGGRARPGGDHGRQPRTHRLHERKAEDIGLGRGREEELFVVNTPANRKSLESLAATDVRLEDPLPPAGDRALSGIFVLYEENIRPVTPLIAEELVEAERTYPAEWIRDAFHEAVSLNKPNWRYIQSILRRWEAEGRHDEEHGRDPEVEWLERRYRAGKQRLESR